MKELKPVFDAANKITSDRMSHERERELFRYLHPIVWIKCSERMPPDDIPYDEATWRECCLPVSPDNKL